MPVPSTIADLSATAASNSPAGSDPIGTSLDDYLRAIQGIVKAEASAGADVASASSITIPAAGSYFRITGNTTITSIADSWTGRKVMVRFGGAITLTHSSGLVIPGAANVATADGDHAVLVNSAAGVWRVAAFQRAASLDAGAINGIVKGNGAGALSAAVPGTDYAVGTATVNLTGNQTIAGVKTFSSQPVLPAPSMVRLHTSAGFGSTNTSIRRFSTTVTNQGTDITYADSASNGASFTVNTAGTYAISYSDCFTSSQGWLGLSVNASSGITQVNGLAASEILAVTNTTAANLSGGCSWTGYLAAGAVIRAHCQAGLSAGSGAVPLFTITRLA